MVQITSSKEQCDKKNEIIAAAQQRFGQFGFKKTSMNEIAGDLDMSKGLLYYYFPDKEHLYNAVIEKEFYEFKTTLLTQLEQIQHPFTMLKEYMKLRLHYFRLFLNLSRFKFDEMKKLKAVLSKSRERFQNFELAVIVDILKKGNAQQLIQVPNPEEMAVLLFDLLRGMRIAIMKDKLFFYLSDEEFEKLNQKYETFIDIFISGLQHQAQCNSIEKV